MISWTLDHTTFKYYREENGNIVWGNPEHGDEVVINEKYSYIFQPENNKSKYREYPIPPSEAFSESSRMDIRNVGTRFISEQVVSDILDNPEHQSNLLQEDNRMIIGNIEPGREETELESYIREARRYL